MNITKQLALEITLKLLEGKKVELTKLQDEFADKVRQMHLAKVPADVKKLAEKYPSYVRTTDSIRIVGPGFNHEIIGVVKAISDVKQYLHTTLEVSGTSATQLSAKWNKVLKAKTAYKDAVKKIEATLFSLRTFKRISEAFPEAIPHLPTETKSTALVNISEVRKLLK